MTGMEEFMRDFRARKGMRGIGGCGVTQIGTCWTRDGTYWTGMPLNALCPDGPVGPAGPRLMSPILSNPIPFIRLIPLNFFYLTLKVQPPAMVGQ